MALTIAVLVLGDMVHPPAVSTALGFAFFARQSEAVAVFLLALLMVAALVFLERLAVWTLVRVQTTSGPRDPGRLSASEEQVADQNCTV